MKIYFEDGPLDIKLARLEFDYDFFIDARNGYSFCEDKLEIMEHFHSDKTVYTNYLNALNNRWVWNDKLKVPELYIRNEEHNFTRVDKLTTRELRQGHNLMKLYMNGEFET